MDRPLFPAPPPLHLECAPHDAARGSALLSPPHPSPTLLPRPAPSPVPRLALDSSSPVFGSGLLEPNAPVFRGVTLVPPALLRAPAAPTDAQPCLPRPFDPAPPEEFAVLPSHLSLSPFSCPSPGSGCGKVPPASARLFLDPGAVTAPPRRPKPLCVLRQVLLRLSSPVTHHLAEHDDDHHHHQPQGCGDLGAQGEGGGRSAWLSAGDHDLPLDEPEHEHEPERKRKHANSEEEDDRAKRRRCTSPSLLQSSSQGSLSDLLNSASASRSPSPTCPLPASPSCPPCCPQRCGGGCGGSSSGDEGPKRREDGLPCFLRGADESLRVVLDDLVCLSAPAKCNQPGGDRELVRACACLGLDSHRPRPQRPQPGLPFSMHEDEGGDEGHAEGAGSPQALLLDSQLEAMLKHSDGQRPRTADLVDELKATACAAKRKNVLVLHLLGELRFVLDTLHHLSSPEGRPAAAASSSSSSPAPSPSPSPFLSASPAPAPAMASPLPLGGRGATGKFQLPDPACAPVLHRLCIALLYSVVCGGDGALGLLDRPENRSHRNWAMAAFFRALLDPVPHRSCPSTVLMAKVGLARLDAKHKKIPREVVECVLRPALMQFCDVRKLTLPLIVGLHSIVGLFPTLFKEVFGKKILGLLEELSGDQPAQRAQQELLASEMPSRSVRAMLVHMVDFFRLFAATCSFSCERWVDRVCKLVVQLEARWGHNASGNSSDNTGVGEGGACSGFRAPLCRFLCHYPAAAVTTIMHRTSGGGDACRLPYADVFQSVLRCRHAVPLVVEYERRAGAVLGACALGSDLSGSSLSSPSPSPSPSSPASSLLGSSPLLWCGALPSQPPSFAAFRNNDALSDVELVVGAAETLVRAHRVVLASGSEFFARLFTNGMHESAQRRVHLRDVNERAFDVVLDFLYGDAHPDLSRLDVDVLCDLHGLADRFALRRLFRLCEHALGTRVSVANLQRLVGLAVGHCDSPSALPRGGLLAVQSCGEAGGEGLLRACQAHLLANLGALAHNLELDDVMMVELLANDHRALGGLDAEGHDAACV